MRSILLVLAASTAALGLVSARTAVADNTTLLKYADPQIIVEIARGFGSAELGKDDGGDPMVTGRLQGVKYAIYFYDCTNAKDCNSIQFSLGYTDAFTPDQANDWNSKYRWIKAYSDNGSNFKMDVDFSTGITRDYLEEQFSTWDSLAPEIRDFVNGK